VFCNQNCVSFRNILLIQKNVCTLFYFLICQGTLPWQPNNVADMKANWYYVHSLHICQMVSFKCVLYAIFIARCNICIYTMSVSVCLSVMEVHWRIIGLANLGFKFWSQFTPHWGRGACGPVMRERALNYWYSSVGAREGIIAGNPSLRLCASILAPKAFGARRTPQTWKPKFAHEARTPRLPMAPKLYSWIRPCKGGAKIEVLLPWQVPKVRGRSATGAERGRIWEGVPAPQQVFSSPQLTRGSGVASWAGKWQKSRRHRRGVVANILVAS